MEYEESLKLWAIERFSHLPLRLEDIANVETSTWDNGYCETCSYVVEGVIVSLTPEAVADKNRFKYVSGYNELRAEEDFGDLVKELFEIAKRHGNV